MTREFKNSEDERVAKAITAAAEGIGMALFKTFEAAGRGDTSTTRQYVKKAWREAADKIIDRVLED